MNAIRMRKENQVYSAEEKQAMALLNYEESKKKEAALDAELKRFLEEKKQQSIRQKQSQQD